MILNSAKPVTAKECAVIIIPTYNEASIIQETIGQIFSVVEQITDFEVKVLIFDSASQDNTQEKVRSLQKNNPALYFAEEGEKSGLGSAYLQAMRYAMHQLDADIVFEFDADLSHKPCYLPGMLASIKTCDVVVGSRYIVGGSIPHNWAWHRKLFSVFGNFIARAILTAKYKDFTSGFRATRRVFLQKVLPEKFLSNNYAYKLQLLWLLHKSGASIREFPIEFIDRTQGESKLPKNTIIDSLYVIFTLRYYELQRYVKICFVGIIGITVQFLLYNLLRSHLPPVNATQIAAFAAIINNFSWKSTLNIGQFFKPKPIMQFIGYSLLMIYLQSSWLKFGLNYVGDGWLYENLFLFSGICFCALLQYFYWVNPRK